MGTGTEREERGRERWRPRQTAKEERERKRGDRWKDKYVNMDQVTDSREMLTNKARWK